MPIKYNLTKCDILANEIHKLSLKELKESHSDNDSSEHEPEDIEIKLMAIIIASLTSSHSWQTYKCIEQQIDGFNAEVIKREHEEAIEERWKHITPSDISELVNLNISDSVFYRWSFFNVNREEHKYYVKAWKRLKEEMSNSYDGANNNIYNNTNGNHKNGK